MKLVKLTMAAILILKYFLTATGQRLYFLHLKEFYKMTK